MSCLEYLWQHLDISFLSQRQKQQFVAQVEVNFPRLYVQLSLVYGEQPVQFHHYAKLLETLAHCYKQRPAHLKEVDANRDSQTHWYQDENMVGMACYVDLVAENIADLAQQIPYFLELGINYLHLMPLYKSPEGDSDGGYAVTDYRKVNPSLGSMKDLKVLAKQLREAGISLVLDFVFNHTADDHEWALKAKKGDPHYQEFYYLFDDRKEPDEFDESLREIFPSVRRGNFTYVEGIDKWAWTTFNNFQWDLKYANPEVFRAMVSEMLFLANIGCDALRLDALAFVWKEKGTDSENLPKAHLLIQAFNTCMTIVAPSVVFKSEAIVHPSEVVKYIAPQECQLSYNPLLMALLWNSLATRKTRLLKHSLHGRNQINQDCSWVNYVRCHDDIGWTFDDGDAGQLGINAYDHRLFLNRFYNGDFPGSFARGQGFQYNPSNGDCRVCGSLASLCGLEQAIANNDQRQRDDAIARIRLLHSIIMSIGGIPLLYQGDELAMLNDYSYEQVEAKKHDTRWVNRPRISADDRLARLDKKSAAGRVFSDLQHMIKIRKSHALFGKASTQIELQDNPHVFAYIRHHKNEQLLCLTNFSEHGQSLNSAEWASQGQRHYLDLLTGNRIDSRQELKLKGYDALWLLPIIKPINAQG